MTDDIRNGEHYMGTQTNTRKRSSSKKNKLAAPFDWNAFWAEQPDLPVIQSNDLRLISSYTDEPALETDTTDPTMPMGENGNELIDPLEIEFLELEIETKPETLTEEELLEGLDQLVTQTVDPPATEATEELIVEALDIGAAPQESQISETLLDEIAANEATPSSIIDHHSQIGSWSGEEKSIDAEDDTLLDEPSDFEKLLSSFDDATVTKMAHAIANAVDERVAFEENKSANVTGKTSIFATLKKVRKELVTKRAARIMLATNTTPDFINRTLHDGSRFNVYALGKYADFVRSLVDGEDLKNAINNAVTRSLFACRREGISFTGEIAKAAASNKIVIDAAIRKHLIRHTVSSGTAPTQASSTMSALQQLGVVQSSGSGRNPVYTVTNAPIASALEKMLSAAA
jgi:hypothetical protein